ncbi:CGNR zinc finger domain-containing protein [Streptomyces sp. A73]|nr:CGNR zinc finger domain-containing protein [Streptomyces sp. RK75]MBQ1124638.1 CGNR zinc finger domain-containing protein [Streptomyces sp. B15]MBQ1159518.1 CGNR zinc finger domain-containing protein [Streptomyces sp. A73]
MEIYFSDYAVGAGVATAMANSSPAIRLRTSEAMGDPAALARFLAEHAVEPTDTRRITRGDLVQVHALREEVRAALAAPTEQEAVERANTLVARAGRGPLLVPGADGWRWVVGTAPETCIADELAVLTGAGLLGSLHALGHDRFRYCAAPECAGVFVDTSRAGRRRYCSPQICGNRHNVAQYRARRKRDSPDRS